MKHLFLTDNKTALIMWGCGIGSVVAISSGMMIGLLKRTYVSTGCFIVGGGLLELGLGFIIRHNYTNGALMAAALGHYTTGSLTLLSLLLIDWRRPRWGLEELFACGTGLASFFSLVICYFGGARLFFPHRQH